MTWLADGNLLVASVVDTHVSHAAARRWFERLAGCFATCSVTQGTLLRLHMKIAEDTSAAGAWRVLSEIEAHPLHVYWDMDLPYRDVPHRLLQGHRQVTDAWLGELARRNDGKVATLDKGLAATYPSEAVLI